MDGLQRDKYCIIERETGVEMQSPAFVLSPTKADAFGLASRKALRAFAAAIYDTNSQFARDMVAWIDEIDGWHDLV